MHILVTGAAGFIGADLSQKLLEIGHTIIGLDNINDYYDVGLKRARLKNIQQHSRAAQNFQLCEIDIVDRAALSQLFKQNKFDVVVHLAAQAGVRYSIENPQSYIDSNLVGFGNILEGCRHSQVKHLVYASSSSVYGANDNFPFSETDRVDNPVSLYAATKKANEQTCMHCVVQACVFSRFMGLGAGQIWHHFVLLQECSNGKPFRSITKVI